MSIELNKKTFVFRLPAHKHIILCPTDDSIAHQLGHKRHRLHLLLYKRDDEHSAVCHPKGTLILQCNMSLLTDIQLALAFAGPSKANVLQQSSIMQVNPAILKRQCAQWIPFKSFTNAR